MCSHSLKRMGDYYHRGDLTDIIRAGGTAADSEAEWQFPSSVPVSFSTRPGTDDFGDPFAHFGDPLLQPRVPRVEDDGMPIGRPNFLSATAQISRADDAKPPPATSSAFRPPHASVPSHDRALRISSPRNTGIRRRKSQAKKVVCVPAPAPANSRSTGEIVPSDLWAWRKYGQKPIKGSPYPRGYYRCSSSKGCPARKQVERSRTDPNMLVITYTSEHNHPWPTQRNALAGSTRSQPSKTNTQSPTSGVELSGKIIDGAADNTRTVDSNNSASVKEEGVGRDDFDTPLGTDQGSTYTSSYRPMLPGANQSEDNFFADLGEIEAGSLGVFGFSGEGGRGSKGLDPFSFYEWAYGEANSKDS